MIEEFVSHGIAVSRIHIENVDMAVSLNKPIGLYTTLDTGPLIDNMQFENICSCLTEELRRYLYPYKGKTLCICGIGNEQRIEDSIGPETIKRIAPQLPMHPFFEKMVAFSPSTYGKTNIETADTVFAIGSVVNASCVLAIDAIECTNPVRLGSNIQVTDTGLKIGWNKKEINASTIGIPVIGIGVPTIIHTKHLNVDIPCDNFLTAANIKSVVKNAALIVSCAIMQVAYPDLDYSTAKWLMMI